VVLGLAGWEIASETKLLNALRGAEAVVMPTPEDCVAAKLGNRLGDDLDQMICMVREGFKGLGPKATEIPRPLLPMEQSESDCRPSRSRDHTAEMPPHLALLSCVGWKHGQQRAGSFAGDNLDCRWSLIPRWELHDR